MPRASSPSAGFADKTAPVDGSGSSALDPPSNGFGNGVAKGWTERANLRFNEHAQKGFVSSPPPPGEPLLLVFGGATVNDMLRNWALHARELKMGYTVACMDQAVRPCSLLPAPCSLLPVPSHVWTRRCVSLSLARALHTCVTARRCSRLPALRALASRATSPVLHTASLLTPARAARPRLARHVSSAAHGLTAHACPRCASSPRAPRPQALHTLHLSPAQLFDTASAHSIPASIMADTSTAGVVTTR